MELLALLETPVYNLVLLEDPQIERHPIRVCLARDWQSLSAALNLLLNKVQANACDLEHRLERYVFDANIARHRVFVNIKESLM